MNSSEKKSRLKIRSRLMLLNIGIGIGCIIVLTVVSYSFRNVSNLISQVTEQHMTELTNRSLTSRNLSQIFADTSLLLNNFYGQEEHLKTEGARIANLIREATASSRHPGIIKSLKNLQKNLFSFLDTCALVNETLKQRSLIQTNLNTTLSQLEDTIAEQTIGLTLKSKDTSFMEQLSLLAFGYREDLLRIEKLNAEIDTEHFKMVPKVKDSSLVQALNDFKLHIRPLTASPRQIAMYGKQLALAIDAYKQNVQTLHNDMDSLNDRAATLTRDQGNLLREMAALDAATARSTRAATQSIETIISGSRTTVLGIFILMVTAIGFFTLFVVKFHVQIPLQTILQGIHYFRQGEFGKRITMDRKDEWAEIQEALNSMARELKSSYQALRTSETTYRGIVDNAFDGIFQLDMSGRFRSANPAMAHILGYDSQKELLQEHKNSLIHLYLDQNHQRALHTFLETQEHVRHFETPIFIADHPPIWVALNTRHVTTDEGTYIEGTMTDITARKQSEMELERLRNYLDNIINSMPSILIGVDQTGKITQWNREAEIRLGVQRVQALGNSLETTFPQLGKEIAKVRLAITRKTPQKDSKVTLTIAGVPKIVDVTVFPLTTNAMEGAVIRIDDISDQVRMEEMMIQSEKMLSVGGLAAGMAHEINNPLASILQAAQVMHMRLSDDLPRNIQTAKECGTSMEKIRNYMGKRRLLTMLDAIQEAGQRAAKIVENMLSFSRKGNSEMSMEDLGELMDKTIELAKNDYDLKKKYDFRQIEIVREYEPQLPLIPCEASKIQQVFLNLLKNGSQAMAEIRTTDQEATYQPRFNIKIRPDKNVMKISVQDNGPGMEETTRKRIFEPFFTTKDVGIGTGLGLSVSYFIITDNHKGMMYVESCPGKGTRFVIKLPLKQSAPVSR
ncbi:MAG: PAS domain S-box protein [Desulfoplanes sp.]